MLPVVALGCSLAARVHAVAPPATEAASTQPIKGLPFAFPAGADAIVVPLQTARDSLYVAATINGHDVRYLNIDTGSTQSVLQADTATVLLLRLIGERRISAIQNTEYAGIAKLKELSFGGVTVKDWFTYVAPQNGTELSGGGRMAGVIGMDLLGQCPITLDFRAATLTIHSPAAFRPPRGAASAELRSDSATPLIEASVEGRRGWFELDTGYTSTLLLSHAFVRINHDLVGQRPALTLNPNWEGSSDKKYTSNWSGFELFGRRVPEETGEWQAEPGGLTSVAGLIGTTHLRDTRLTIDMRSHRAWREVLPEEPLAALLRRLGDDVNAHDLSGTTPLLSAAFLLRDDAIADLVRRGADVNASDMFGTTPLMVAVARGDFACAKCLLGCGAKVDARGAGPGITALHYAAMWGRANTGRMLLAAGADVNAVNTIGRTPLFMAADAGHPNVMRVLLAHGAAVDKPLPGGATPLVAACRQGNVDCVRLLLEHGANPNAHGTKHTALTAATNDLTGECVRLLLTAGADANQGRPEDGYTPLMAAADSTLGETCVRLLLAAGANPHATTKSGWTAWDSAMRNGSGAILRMLAPYAESPTTTHP